MTPITVQFMDPAHRLVATGRVTEAQGLFRGEIDLVSMPEPLRRIFDEYEEMVANQTFSLLDEIEDKVNDIGIRVRFGEQADFAIEDLQIYPSTARVSFRLAQADFAVAADSVLKKNSALYKRLA